MRDYILNISLGDGKNYSMGITDEEWEAFVTAANGKPMDGFVVPDEVLMQLWNEDIPVPEKATVVKAYDLEI